MAKKIWGEEELYLNETLLHWTSTNVELQCSCILTSIHQEHVVPMVKDGGYTKENIIPSCPTCNLSKGSKSVEKFSTFSNSFNYGSYLKTLSFLDISKSLSEQL